MKDLSKEAEARFLAGANCAQSVLGAFAETVGLDETTALRLASGFGGGIGRQREVCGAVSGICMAAGLLYGYEDPRDADGKADTYQMIRELCAEFKALHGSIYCRDLLGRTGEGESARAEERTPAYYAQRPCAALCRDAAAILCGYIRRREEKP